MENILIYFEHVAHDRLSPAVNIVWEWLKSTTSDRKQIGPRFHIIAARYAVHYCHVRHLTCLFCNPCADNITKPIGRRYRALFETHGLVCLVCGFPEADATGE